MKDCETAFHSTYQSAGFKGFDGCTEWLKMADRGLEAPLTGLFDLKPYPYRQKS